MHLRFKNTGSIFCANLDVTKDYGGHPRCTRARSVMDLPVHDDSGAFIGIRHRDIELAGSITWLAGEELTLPAEVAELPQVKARIAARKMIVRA